MELLPAISVNKHVAVNSDCSPPMWASEPLRELRKEENICYPAAIRLQLFPEVSPREAQDVKTQDSGPRPLRCIWKNDFSEHMCLHLHIEKSAKFLNLSYLVFFIVNNLWLQTTCPLLQIFYISWLPTSTPHLLKTVLSGLLEMLPPKNYHQMKHKC